VAITKKPKEAEIEALIDKGGSVAKEKASDTYALELVQLRIPADMLKRLDAALKTKPYKQARHPWILDAIYEKMQRDFNI
jgi:hypothetical protein